ncbi:MAG: hypothetical protein HQ517_16730 [SAR324 cluster bacterium]|nr:hypothetical protein [SAR324 cluster bacterium]
MKLFAQHGYGQGEKIISGIRDQSINGAIFCARYGKQEKLIENTKQLKDINPDVEILFDPEFYAYIRAHDPNAQLGGLAEWKYFEAYKRSQLEDTKIVETILKNSFGAINELPLTSIIAPNVYIPKSFDSIEAVIAKNFIRKAKPVFKKTKDPRKLYVTLAIGRDALLNQTEFDAFLDDITTLDDPPDGFYILVGGGSSEEKTDITESEIIHTDVIAGWMLLNYVLTINGFNVINGCSDILTPFLGSVGAYAGATGWWINLRMFAINKYIKSAGGGGRLPIVKYLSNLILRRIKFSDREAFSKLMPEINNNLPHDTDYQTDAPERKNEVLQTWEAIAQLNKDIIVSDVQDSLRNAEDIIDNAEMAYTKLSSFGFPVDRENNRQYMEALREGTKKFKKNAEI